MNSRTAKLLKKYSTVIGANYRKVKREWIKTPWRQKSKLRKEMKLEIEE